MFCRCDERFIGYGGNKAACLFELYLSGVSFYVLPDDFLIHQSHAYAEKARKHERRYNRKLYTDFREELCFRYLNLFLDQIESPRAKVSCFFPILPLRPWKGLLIFACECRTSQTSVRRLKGSVRRQLDSSQRQEEDPPLNLNPSHHHQEQMVTRGTLSSLLHYRRKTKDFVLLFFPPYFLFIVSPSVVLFWQVFQHIHSAPSLSHYVESTDTYTLTLRPILLLDPIELLLTIPLLLASFLVGDHRS